MSEVNKTVIGQVQLTGTVVAPPLLEISAAEAEAGVDGQALAHASTRAVLEAAAGHAERRAAAPLGENLPI